jgi:hypothetical protein
LDGKNLLKISTRFLCSQGTYTLKDFWVDGGKLPAFFSGELRCIGILQASDGSGTNVTVEVNFHTFE